MDISLSSPEAVSISKTILKRVSSNTSDRIVPIALTYIVSMLNTPLDPTENFMNALVPPMTYLYP